MSARLNLDPGRGDGGDGGDGGGEVNQGEVSTIISIPFICHFFYTDKIFGK